MAAGDDVVTNFKRTLLENRQETKKHMEKYLTILFQHLKDIVQPQQRVNVIAKPDRLTGGSSLIPSRHQIAVSLD